jgi:hypothetical protein
MNFIRAVKTLRRLVDDVLGSPRRSRSDCLCSRLLHEFRFRHGPPPE